MRGAAGKSTPLPDDWTARHECLCDDDIKRIADALMDRIATMYALPRTLQGTMKQRPPRSDIEAPDA